MSNFFFDLLNRVCLTQKKMSLQRRLTFTIKLKINPKQNQLNRGIRTQNENHPQNMIRPSPRNVSQNSFLSYAQRYFVCVTTSLNISTTFHYYFDIDDYCYISSAVVLCVLGCNLFPSVDGNPFHPHRYPSQPNH